MLAVPITPTGAAAATPDPQSSPSTELTEIADTTVSTVMLISGDQVTHTQYPDGTVTVTVAAAERPDGRPAAFETVQSDDGYYVIPTDAWPLLADGVLDQQLFNVTTLVADGLAAADRLPVIVTTDNPWQRATALLGMPTTATLSSIGGTAVQLDSDAAGTLWAGLTGAGNPARAAASAAIDRIWLDRAVTVSLADSVPQIGAPAVHDAGFDGSGVTVAVLDTGIDPTHPDIDDRIVTTANFTDDPSAVDGHGHGTHVASIIAGSGEASGGERHGVAPGAELLIGKVLPNSGRGPTSAVIEGMEWAAHAGADIVNLSLGACCSDGTDPASLAVDRLTAETGTLFVIASGNNEGNVAVNSPGTASSALTVGAVDKSDLLAGFSNRGPRRGDAAVKPELTAPGAGIVAARAAGTSMGSPVDDRYTSANGTSMATPHVAGSAALLLQANPDWSWDQLKDALVSTSVPGDYTTFQGGAGRVDIARAVTAGVYGPAAANFGAFPAPYDEQRTEELTYRNHTDTDVTLELSLTGQAWTGDDLPEGAVALGASTITVPAGGTASVPLTVDASVGRAGAYTGVVTATAGDLQLRTPFGYYKGAGGNTLTVEVTDIHGNPADGTPVRVVKLDGAEPNDPFHLGITVTFTDDSGVAQIPVADGLYDVYSDVADNWDLFADRLTSVAETELPVTEDVTVRLEAADAVLVSPVFPEPTDVKAADGSYHRGFVDGEFASGWAFQYGRTELYMEPVQVETGWMEIRNTWQVTSVLVDTAEVRAGQQRVAITPQYHNFYAGPMLAGDRDLPLVSAGAGSSEELAAADLAGKVALVGIPVPPEETNPPYYVFTEHNRITAEAIQLGAAGVVFFVDEPGALGLPGEGPQSREILQLSLPYDEGIAARELAEAGSARLVLSARRDPERIYRLRELHTDASLPEPRMVVDPDELVQIENRYHADEPGYHQRMFSSAFTPREELIGGLAVNYWAPMTATEYILPGEHLRWIRSATQLGPPGGGLQLDPMESREVFLPGDTRETEVWFQSPIRTGAADIPVETAYSVHICTFCRHADRFMPGIYYLDSDPRHRYRSFLLDGTTYRMFAGDQEIPNSGSTTSPWFQLSPEPASYRLVMEGVQPGVPQSRTLAPRIHSEWTFRSSQPAPDQAAPDGYRCPFTNLDGGCAFQPLLQLDYQLNLDLLNRAPAGARHTFTVTVAPHSTIDRGRPVTPTGFRIWYSTDNGETWQQPRVRPAGRGSFEVTITHPPLAETDGYVWLRAEARDGTGNQVEQTIERAYALR
ncbi:MAG TPA: S8 family serine peptidase [Natronosporangium sp.]